MNIYFLKQEDTFKARKSRCYTQYWTDISYNFRKLKIW